MNDLDERTKPSRDESEEAVPQGANRAGRRVEASFWRRAQRRIERAVRRGAERIVAVLRSFAKLLLDALKQVLDQPYLVFNAVLTLLASVGIYATLVIGAVHSFPERIMSGDVPAMTLVLATAIALMCGSMAMAVLAGKTRSEKFYKLMEMKMRNMQLDNNALLDELSKLQRKVAYLVSRDEEEAKRVSNLSIRRINDAGIWSKLKAGSSYFTINSYAQSDIEEYRGANGQVRARVDRERLIKWLSRFAGPNRLLEIEHIFLQSEGNVKDDLCVLPDGAVRLLTAYSAIRKFRDANGECFDIDLSNVRFRICTNDFQTSQAIFIGSTDGPSDDTKEMRFVLRYDVMMLITRHRGLFDRTVEQCLDPTEVAAYEQCAQALIDQAARTFTIDELLEKYADAIPEIDEFDTALDTDMMSELGLRISHKGEISETIDFGDGSFRV